ncbi:ABC transporter permease [Streptomyces sp. NPDC052052]|uniref:ABC transporter permease n=1 Tax=Streptomyces sp. NPDC052052 TaxID=3154756 RepID=UPI0034221EFC
MVDYLRLEIRRTWRDGSYVVFTIGLPVLLYLLFSNVGDGPHDSARTRLTLMVGMAAYGGIGASLGNGSTVAEDKALGWLRQLRIVPLSPAKAVAGRMLTGMLVVLPAIAAVLLAGALVDDVKLDAGQWIGIAVLLWLGTAPFVLLGLGNGYWFSSSAANNANMACTILLAVAGGLWIPVTDFPGWLAALAHWTPGHVYGAPSWTVADGSTPGLTPFLTLAGWLALFAAWAVRAYRRASEYD